MNRIVISIAWTLVCLYPLTARDQIFQPFNLGYTQPYQQKNPTEAIALSGTAFQYQLILPLGVRVSAGNNSLALPYPQNIWSSPYPYNQMFIESITRSIDIESKTPEEVSQLITRHLRNGITAEAMMEPPPFQLNFSSFGTKQKNDLGLSYQFSSNGFVHIPGTAFLLAFSSTDGLLPGNWLPFDKFAMNMEMVSEFKVTYCRKISAQLFSQSRYPMNLYWGLGATYRIGHFLVHANTPSAYIDYQDPQKLSMHDDGTIMTSGFQYDNLYHFDKHSWSNHPFSINGHGFGISPALTLKSEFLAFGIGVDNIGKMTWNKDVIENTLSFHQDNIVINNLSNHSDSVLIEIRTNKDRKKYSQSLQTEGFVETAYRSRNVPQTTVQKVLSSHRLVSIQYTLPLTSYYGIRKPSTFTIKMQNGFFHDAMPVNVGWSFGGFEQRSSSATLIISRPTLSFSLLYRAIGHHFFKPERGIELGFQTSSIIGRNKKESYAKN